MPLIFPPSCVVPSPGMILSPARHGLSQCDGDQTHNARRVDKHAPGAAERELSHLRLVRCSALGTQRLVHGHQQELGCR